jgi:uncharacterized membrane protein
MDVAALRETFLAAPESTATRVLAAVLALGVVALVLWLVKSRRLRLELTPIWILGAVGLAVLSASFDLLRALTRLIGAWTPSATLFFLSVTFLGLVCLVYAVRISRLVIQVKNLAQELAILRAEMERRCEGDDVG